MQNKKTHPSHEWHSLPESVNVLPIFSDEPELVSIPLPRAILKLAGPAMTSMLFIMVFNLVDIWWVGKLGSTALAGVSGASFILWTLQAAATCVGTGVNALVARHVGAKHPAKASDVVGQGLLVALFLSLVLTISGFLTQKTLFIKMGLTGDVLGSALDYMTVIIAGLSVIFTFFALDAAFRGAGDTKTPLKLISVALTFNMLLDPVLIFGWGPFPAMGTAGAALATVIAHGVMVIWAALLLAKRQVGIRLNPGIKRIVQPDVCGEIVRIGSPIALSGIMFSISYMVLTRVISRFGPAALAALGVGHRIEGIPYFTALGFSVAAATLVGQNLGAQKPKRAEKATWLAVLYASVIIFSFSVVCYIFAGTVVRFFTADTQVVSEGIGYLRIIAIFEIFLAFEVVLEGAFGGAGHSLPPMTVSIPITWARIPLALLLITHFAMGTAGIWLAIATTTGLKGLVLAFWFNRGTWKK
ncbi:MATE family efflux transporter [candidate division KSB1 bacterium]|nr:MATE family efflux transporter [candidate division KSB1 bacterium]